MSKQHEFDIKIKATGIDVHRKVDEDIGRRIVAILLSGKENGQDEIKPRDDGAVNVDNVEGPSAPANRDEFFTELKDGKPSDNALAIAAYHYGQYGSVEFSVKEMQDLADDVGVTVPERLDMTYLQAKRKGNRLFRRGGRGAFRPTVHGEALFKKAYKVPKGTNQKPGGVVK